MPIPAMIRLPSDLSGPVEVVLAGPNARLTLTFDGDQRATVLFEGIGLRAAASGWFLDGVPEVFARDLLLAHASLRGAAAFESEDGEFDVRVVYANGGEVTVSGRVQPSPDDPSALEYAIATDQSYLNAAIPVLRGLRRAP